MAELSTGLLLACLATLRALVARFLPSWRKAFTTAQISRGNYASESRDPQGARVKHTTPTISSTTGNWLELSDESNVEMGRLAEAHTEPVTMTRKSSDDWEPTNGGVKVVREFRVRIT
jgi:hypothetical protein